MNPEPKTDPLTGLMLPHQPEAILASNYGDMWRIPDEGWRFDWPKAKQDFADFLGHIEADE